MHPWFWIIGWFPTILAVTGNALVIWAVTTRRRLRTIANRFIMSLAVADFCIGFFLFPALFTCKKWPTYCTAHHKSIISTCLGFFVHASAANLCAMTTDRYIAIALPLRYITYMTSKRSFCMITAAWVFPATVWIIFTVLVHYLGAPSVTVFVVNTLMKCVFEILPAILLIIATYHMLIIVRRHKKEISILLADLRFNSRTSKDRPSVVRRSPEASSAKVVGVVVLAFVLCYSVEIYFSFCQICPLILVDVVLLLLVINAAANPLAYAFIKKDIKREVQTFFKSIRKRRPVVIDKS